MTAMVGAILLASLLGSWHCAGMCGAFVALAVGDSRSWRTPLAYHVGRLVSYLLLGAAAGLAGSLVNVTATLSGLRAPAAMLAGAAMLLFGIICLLRSRGVQISHLKLPSAWSRLVTRLSMLAMNRPPLVRAGIIGLCTTLLPCGWLYAFAVTAAGTAHPLSGAAVMAIFWVGTLPALIVVGAGFRGLLGSFGRRAPLLTSLLLVAVGLYTLLGRTMLDPVALASRAGIGSTPACCPEK